MNNNMGLWEAFNELDKLNEENEIVQSLTYQEVRNILEGKESIEAAEKLKQLGINLCVNNKQWKIRPESWPYQIQLMYNAYQLEKCTKEILCDTNDNGITRKEINDALAELCNKTEKLSSKNILIKLADTDDWQFGVGSDLEHDTLDAAGQQILLPDLLTATVNQEVQAVADHARKQKEITGRAPKIDIKYLNKHSDIKMTYTNVSDNKEQNSQQILIANAVEVKGTVGKLIDAHTARFHGADIAFVYDLANKKEAKLSVYIVGGKVLTQKGFGFKADEKIAHIDISTPVSVDCITVGIQADKYPSVSDLTLDDKGIILSAEAENKVLQNE